MIFGPEIDDHMPEIRQISQNFTKIFKYDVSKLGWGILDCADSAEGAIMEIMLT